MIEKLIDASIRHRFVVLTVATALAAWAIYTVLQTPVDAIPDLGENQVIIFTDWPGRSPREIEDQVTYPLSLKLEGLAGVKAVRASSEFNFSVITLIFGESVNFYFARERVLEKLTQVSDVLPAGVTPYLAPDATALGQIFWYTLEGGQLDSGQRWALQKFHVAPELNAVSGVAEVATVGGKPKEYQIDVDPNALRAYGVTLGEVYDAVAQSNSSVGGGVVQKGNAEYLVRGIGWIENTRDIENTVVKQVRGTPIYVKNLATVQVGSQFRRSVLEKDGNEVVGGVVLMRYGESPLAVTERVKKKIQELQSALPAGVHIVPAYDRTGLIHGAIDTLTTVMGHEMLIACLAILLILMHFRSAFVICVTLPLAVLFSFLMMWLLRVLHIIDIQANIMSLAGITISIGILVDQAIVMVENATHRLKAHFGDARVTGDTHAIVSSACRTVGRPIFFSVMIILLSFAPILAMSGREGKYFHPMAWTKSLAMIGVALLSVTVVPALIPTFVRGRLRGEEENWIVRSFIHIYRPVIEWALERRNLVMWAFAVLLILAAGLFPIQAVFGLGASHYYWSICFLAVLFLVVSLTVFFTHGIRWQVASFLSLVLLGLAAYRFPKIGVDFMPPLDEGTLMDMPVTVPRASVTEAADDIKARDALLRGFPEVESVIGKAGRADTPTDPAPLEMIETFLNFRPKELWPKRAMKFNDASRQTRAVLAALEERGYLMGARDGDRDDLVNDAAMRALTQFDETMRALALDRYRAFEHELGPRLTRFAVTETVRRFRDAGVLSWPANVDEDAEIDNLVKNLSAAYGPWLTRKPALEDVTRISQAVADQLAARKALTVDPAAALAPAGSPVVQVMATLGQRFGAEPRTFAGDLLQAVRTRRTNLWTEQVRGKIDWELFDRGVEAFTWAALEEIAKEAKERKLLAGAAHGTEFEAFGKQAVKAHNARPYDRKALKPFVALRQELEKPFAKHLLLWRREPGKHGDLLQEIDSVVQMPGWSNIWTQPIQNRVDMLSTGVRTPIGVKVFGSDVATIDRVSRQVADALRPLPEAVNVVATPITGKGYIEIKINRQKAARYGVRVGDIQDTIEVALGGRVITQTVEGRDRFPVRLRYARDFRQDEQSIRRLLVSAGGRQSQAELTDRSSNPRLTATTGPGMAHADAPPHAVTSGEPLQIPLDELAQVNVVEGPRMIPSENGQLVNYVTLDVRGGSDTIGFVEEAQRVVAEKVKLPEGIHLEWSGEFENQARAAQTLRIIWPAVFLVIFLILYMTYNDLADAALMMLAVPEALAGGVFFQVLFPKVVAWDWSVPPVNFSVAVWVGYIAAFGMAAETGIIMLVYLREAIDRRGGLEKIGSLAELRQAVIEGAVHRLRPKLLTEGVAILAIAPMLFHSGVGSEILSAMALPVLGGLLIADEVVDIFLPVRFYWVRRARWLKLHAEPRQPRVVSHAFVTACNTAPTGPH